MKEHGRKGYIGREPSWLRPARLGRSRVRRYQALGRARKAAGACETTLVGLPTAVREIDYELVDLVMRPARERKKNGARRRQTQERRKGAERYARRTNNPTARVNQDLSSK